MTGNLDARALAADPELAASVLRFIAALTEAFAAMPPEHRDRLAELARNRCTCRVPFPPVTGDAGGAK